MADRTTNHKNLPAVIQNAISAQKIDLSNVNFLLPSETYGQVISEYEKVMIEVVRVDPNQAGGDVYEVARGKLALSSRPLMAISHAINVKWHPTLTGKVEDTPRKSTARAVGVMRKPNGELITMVEEKTVDLDAIEEEQRIKFEDEAEKGCPYWSSGQKHYKAWKSDAEKKKWIEREVQKAVLSYKKFKNERAMTGAKGRVIKKFVALKSTYTAEELRKPFAFPCVFPDAKKMLERPELQQAAIDKMTGSVQSIFGPESTSFSSRPKEIQADYQVVDGEEPGRIEEKPPETEKENAGFQEPPEEGEIPFSQRSLEEEEIDASLAELRKLVRISYLAKEAKAEAAEVFAQDKPSLDSVNDLVSRIKEWLQRPDVVQKHGRYEGVAE